MSVVLFIQHKKHIHRIMFLSVVYLAVPYSSTLSHKWQDFGEKNTLN